MPPRQRPSRRAAACRFPEVRHTRSSPACRARRGRPTRTPAWCRSYGDPCRRRPHGSASPHWPRPDRQPQSPDCWMRRPRTAYARPSPRRSPPAVHRTAHRSCARACRDQARATPCATGLRRVRGSAPETLPGESFRVSARPRAAKPEQHDGRFQASVTPDGDTTRPGALTLPLVGRVDRRRRAGWG